MKILTSTELAKEAYKIIEKVSEECSDDVKESVRSRCRELYSYLFKAGILSTISYIYAKAEEVLVKNAFRWLTGLSKMPPEGREDAGYAIYGASFCILFEKINLSKNDASLGKLIESLTSSPENLMVIEDQALRFAGWLKKFAEALITKVQ